MSWFFSVVGFIKFLCFCKNNVDNAELYSKVGVPFVMGTTGGDRNKLYETVEEAKIYAVISPQMGKQVCVYSHVSGRKIFKIFLAHISLPCWFTRLLLFLRQWRLWLSSSQEPFLVTPWRLLSYFC